jgi:hypothetical protein
MDHHEKAEHHSHFTFIALFFTLSLYPEPTFFLVVFIMIWQCTSFCGFLFLYVCHGSTNNVLLNRTLKFGEMTKLRGRSD